MIYFVGGTLSHIFDDFVVIDAHGVGYQVWIPERLKATLPSIGKNVQFFTVAHYREDHQDLFGFLSDEDRKFFVDLTSVSGVGPKLGLKLMSEYTSSDLIQIILSGTLPKLVAVSGVGKKIAERIILELKDKLAKSYAGVMTEGKAKFSFSTPGEGLKDDIMAAFRALGYQNEEIKRALVKGSPEITDSTTVEGAIKILLKYI